jgi:hypothetical protein
VRQRADVESALGARAVLGVEPSTPLRLKQSLDGYVTPCSPPARRQRQPATRRVLAARPDLRRLDAEITSLRPSANDLAATALRHRFDGRLHADEHELPQYGMTSTGSVIRSKACSTRFVRRLRDAAVAQQEQGAVAAAGPVNAKSADARGHVA